MSVGIHHPVKGKRIIDVVTVSAYVFESQKYAYDWIVEAEGVGNVDSIWVPGYAWSNNDCYSSTIYKLSVLRWSHKAVGLWGEVSEAEKKKQDRWECHNALYNNIKYRKLKFWMYMLSKK